MSYAAGAVVAVVAIAAAQPAADPVRPDEAAVDPQKVVLVVGDVKMTAAEFEQFLDALPEAVQAEVRGPGRRRAAEELVKLRLLAAEARSRGLDKTPTYRMQLSLMQDNILAGLLRQELEERPVTDEEVERYFKEHPGEFDRLTLRHILIATTGPQGKPDADAAKEAADIVAQLAKGGDFAAIARAKSGDLGSRIEGGLLPPIVRGQTLPEFEKAAFALSKGQTSAPVKTDFGYHIIRMEDREVAQFANVKDEVAERVRARRLEMMIEELMKKNPPNLDPAYFGPAAR